MRYHGVLPLKLPPRELISAACHSVVILGELQDLPGGWQPCLLAQVIERTLREGWDKVIVGWNKSSGTLDPLKASGKIPFLLLPVGQRPPSPNLIDHELNRSSA